MSDLHDWMIMNDLVPDDILLSEEDIFEEEE